MDNLLRTGRLTSRIFFITILANLMYSFAAFADGPLNAAKIDLEVVVDGVCINRGNVRIAVFSEAEAVLFPDRLPLLKQSAAADDRFVIFHFANIIAGRYAIAVLQDENRNEVLDRNLFGIPTERWGITGKRPLLRTPDFAKSTFVLDNKHQSINIYLE